LEIKPVRLPGVAQRIGEVDRLPHGLFHLTRTDLVAAPVVEERTFVAEYTVKDKQFGSGKEDRAVDADLALDGCTPAGSGVVEQLNVVKAGFRDVDCPLHVPLLTGPKSVSRPAV